MKRISQFTPDEIIDYNLRDNGTAITIFADAQPYRVSKARWFIEMVRLNFRRRIRIVELGCSAGDISGFFSLENEVIGIDVVPAAIEQSLQRYPEMSVLLSKVEELDPIPCDILVMTEFLEHVDDPIALAVHWMPQAEYVIIGHPLNDPGSVEPGHIWSYSIGDYYRWFSMVEYKPIETHLFSLGPFPEMIMGVGGR